MAYYVSAIKGRRKALAVGPFRRHGDALALVDRVRRWADRHVHDVDYFDTAWGTARNRAGHPPGRLNEAFGVMVDSAGYIVTPAR
jgi:hypothetical protein